MKLSGIIVYPCLLTLKINSGGESVCVCVCLVTFYRRYCMANVTRMPVAAKVIADEAILSAVDLLG
jgi:hypothetical protein